ncbi:MAG: DUF1729 domain-containing protein, partial [Thermoplasmata archaeon]
ASSMTVSQCRKYIIDLGPGKVATLLARPLLEGKGIGIITAGQHGVSQCPSSNSGSKGSTFILDRGILFEPDVEKLPSVPSWEEEYRVRVVKVVNKEDRDRDIDGGQKQGSINAPVLVNRFTKMTGKMPFLAAGMTPTTGNPELIAALSNAGYHAELAGGALPTERHFRSAVERLLALLKPGCSFGVNLLYLDPYLWGFQFPLMVRLCREGVPIDTLTIGAGIPTPEKAKEIIDTLDSCGIKYLSLKPANADAIKQVVALAKQHPAKTMILQWTGGRGGGHHSLEDFHAPLLQTYSLIRSCSNILLVVGSGFGGWKDSLPYLTGEWSLKYGVAAMPVDGILLGTRLLAAKEAATAPAVKKLLVEAPGVENEKDWEKTMLAEGAGGVITVQSELGAAIHVLSTRCTRFWRWLDDNIFALPQEQMAKKIAENRTAIIEGLNKDSLKPYFWMNSEGKAVPPGERTYREVANRLVSLMYVRRDRAGNPTDKGRWLETTWCILVFKFLLRVKQRFAVNFRYDEEKENALYEILIKEPEKAVESVFRMCPEGERFNLTSEDVDFFIGLCKSSPKPVNFVPVIDAELKRWFKKDSLWYMEDLGAAPDADVQRLFILAGPVSVRYIEKVDEPVVKIFEDAVNGVAEVGVYS